jgi:flagellar biosynthesis/type III secretory pathway chaperone
MLEIAHSHDLTLHLNELMPAITAFKKLLVLESETLKQYQNDQLYQISEKKLSQAQQLEKLTKNLLNTYPDCKTCQQIRENTNFKALPKSTQDLFDQFIEELAECQRLNLQNGIKIQSFQNMNNEMLKILTQNTNNNLYNSTGQTKGSSLKSSLAKA